MAKQDELISSVIQKILNETGESKNLQLTLDDFIELYRAFIDLQGKPTKRKQKIYELVTYIHNKRSGA